MEQSLETKNSTTDSQKQRQLLATLQWIDENYEWSEGVCVPRCVLYQHYQDFCKKRGFVCIGPATFGKVIRQRFSKVTTRRLGTRGQSRYHYYGIGIKKTSLYYKQAYAGKGLSRFSGVQIKTDSPSKKYSLSSKYGTLLPSFPDFEDFIPTTDLDQTKAKTFLVMYRAHCQRILDAVIVANFGEVHKFLLHFWQRMPEHLLESLKSEMLTRMVIVCDVLLYKVINDVLIPSNIQELPESLYQDVQSFNTNLLMWLEESLDGCPSFLKASKLEVASWFKALMRKQLSFIKLAQTTRAVISNVEATKQMAKDLCSLDILSITKQLIVFLHLRCFSWISKINNYYQRLIMLLLKQSPLEDYMEWLDDVIDNFLSEISNHVASWSNESLSHDVIQSRTATAAHFVLIWSYFGSLITRDLTLQNASSFGSVQLMYLMFDEYVLLVAETQRMRQKSKLLQKDMTCWLKPDSKFDVASIVLETKSVENQNDDIPEGGEIGNISGNYVSNDSNFSANIKSCAAITGNTKNEHCFKDVFQDCVNNFHEDSISEIRSKELKCDNAQNFIRYESSCEQQIECQKSSRLLLDEDINRGSNVNSYQVNNYESVKSNCRESDLSSTSYSFHLPPNPVVCSGSELPHYSNYPECQIGTTCTSGLEAVPFCRTQHPEVLLTHQVPSRGIVESEIPKSSVQETSSASFTYQNFSPDLQDSWF